MRVVLQIGPVKGKCTRPGWVPQPVAAACARLMVFAWDLADAYELARQCCAGACLLSLAGEPGGLGADVLGGGMWLLGREPESEFSRLKMEAPYLYEVCCHCRGTGPA